MILTLLVYIIILFIPLPFHLLLLLPLLALQGLLTKWTSDDLGLLRWCLEAVWVLGLRVVHLFFILILVQIKFDIILLRWTCAPSIVNLEVAILSRIFVWKVLLGILERLFLDEVFIHVFSAHKIPWVAHSLTVFDVLLSKLSIIHLPWQLFWLFGLRLLLFNFFDWCCRLCKGIISRLHELDLSNLDGWLFFCLVLGFHDTFGGLFLKAWVYQFLLGTLSNAHLAIPLPIEHVFVILRQDSSESKVGTLFLCSFRCWSNTCATDFKWLGCTDILLSDSMRENELIPKLAWIWCKLQVMGHFIELDLGHITAELVHCQLI